MLKILCPTDFSPHAKKALNYAVQLCNLLDAELHIITAFKVPTGAAGGIKMQETIKHNRLLELNTLASGVVPQLVHDRPPLVVARKGTAPSVIQNYIKHNDISLVVMGTQGSGSVKNLLFGSVTRKVARKLHVPLLAIPDDVEFDDLKGKSFLLTLDSNQVEHEEVLNIPKLLAEKLNIKIDILHVAKNKQDMPVDPFAIKYVEEYLGDLIIKESHFPLVEINTYLSEEEVGMLIMIHRSKGFIENIFLKGFTEEELGMTSTPLLMLPES